MGRDVPVTGVFAVLALILGLAGCAARVPAPLQTFRGVDREEDVLALDEAAYRLVAVQKRQIERLPDGRIHVRLELANLSDQDLAVQIQTLFRDEGGALTGDATPFEMIVLPGGGSKLYEATSLAPAAETFTVQVKAP